MSFNRTRINLVYLLFCQFCFFIPALAQGFQHTENTADISLRSNLQVDPSTLGMTLSIPLNEYPGRNGANLPVTLNYGSKVWRLETVNGFPTEGGGFHTQNQPIYAEHSTSGWTSSLDPPEIEYVAGSQSFDSGGDPKCLCTYEVNFTPYAIERLLIHMPDGSTHELRKNDTPVLRDTVALAGIYYAVDSSQLKFDADTATLYLPDGSRYLLAAPGGAQFIDRNGNTLSYNSTSKQWTDTLGRVISLPPLQNSAPGDFQYSLPGFGGTNKIFTFRFRFLNDVRTDPSQPLRYKGDKDCSVDPELTYGQSLFTSTPFSEGSASVCHGFALFNPVVLWQIILPNNLAYTFTYNIYGEIDKVVLPTGGYQRFNHNSVDCLSTLELPWGEANRGVREYFVSAKGDGTDEVRWQYSAVNEGLKLMTTVIEPTGAKSERLMHIHTPPNIAAPFGFADARTGRAYEERTYAANGQMIRRTLTEWTMSGALPVATRNPRPTKKVEILLDAGGNALAATTVTSSDNYLNELATYRYAYVSVNPTTAQTGAINSFPLGALLRAEESTFLVNDANIPQATRDAYRARHLISLPSYTRVTNGVAVVAETQLKYDESAYPPLAYGSTPTGWTNPNVNERGNVTTTRRWLNASGPTVQTYPNGSFLETHAQYDQCGNPRKVWDGKGKIAETFYTDSFSDGVDRNTFAYATSVTTPIPDPTGASGSNQPLTSSTVFEFNTGKVVATTDVNNKTTSYFYTDDGGALDSLQRLRRVTLPDGLGETKYEYGDAPGGLYIRTLTKQSATTWLESRAHFDGLGRAWRGGHYEGPNSWSVKDTEYDPLGRVKRVTNPYIAANLSGATPGNAAWTTTTYDDLNRVLAVTAPDGATVETIYGGNQVTVNDPTNKKRRSVTDALGRLARVVEDPDGVAFQTDYSYDTLGNLTEVNQGGQRRYFFYDSLGRLTRAKNPEQGANSSLNLTNPPAYNNNWSLAYTYDANGNLTERKDARGVGAGYSYDALNRNTGTNYDINGSQTRSVEMVYDGEANGKGRLRYERTKENGVNATQTEIVSYDALGRALNKQQSFWRGSDWGTPYVILQDYDLAGAVKTVTYPSGRTVNYSYDQAGRLNSFTGNLGDGVNRNYATGIQYDAAGLMKREQFGTTMPLYHRRHYNNRGQLFDIRLGTDPNPAYDSDDLNAWAGAAGSWNRGALRLYYSTLDGCHVYGNGGTNNNGNVLRMDHHIPLDDAVNNFVASIDRYDYDCLNRLKSVTELSYTKGPSGNDIYQGIFRQAFLYDPWGNRTIDQANTVGAVNKKAYTVDTATNRLTLVDGAPMIYDAAGNQTNDGSGQRKYDGENRMVEAYNAAGVMVSWYVYDAKGRRVVRTVGSQGTWNIYGIGGELLAEYAVGAAPRAARKEYGDRGGVVLIMSASGSGGGTSFVKPALKSSADLIAKKSSGARRAANRIFSLDKPFTAFGRNKAYGSITADFSDGDDTGTLVRGGPQTTAEEYGNALFASGIEGELLADNPSTAAPSVPQTEQSYRGGRSTITVQGGGVVSVSPTANQSPDPGLGGEAVSSQSNTGHGGTVSSASRSAKGSVSQTKTCLWHSFSSVPGTRTRVTLKFDWTLNANIHVNGFDEFVNATAEYNFRIEYSLDNGS